MSPEASADSPTSRRAALKLGLALGGFTIAWNIAEGLIATIAGWRAQSVALTGFGVDSFIETASAVVVTWRLALEWRARAGGSATLSPEAEARFERVERRAARAAGALLMILAGYIAFDAARRLLGKGAEAEESLVGLILTAISLALMPFLATAKLRVAKRLGSGALRADAFETITCAWLSLTTFLGIGANALLGWSWADPVAGLVLVPLIAREALEGLCGGCSCHECEAE